MVLGKLERVLFDHIGNLLAACRMDDDCFGLAFAEDRRLATMTKVETETKTKIRNLHLPADLQQGQEPCRTS